MSRNRCRSTKNDQQNTSHHKSSRGNASQFFVAGELCRRGYAAVVTMGNTPNTDILCSNLEGTKFVHIQVKTFVAGESQTCSVGIKAERDYGENFFWVLGGIPSPDSDEPFLYYIIPSKNMSDNVLSLSKTWLEKPNKNGLPHKDSSVRIVSVGERPRKDVWHVGEFLNRWDLIENILR